MKPLAYQLTEVTKSYLAGSREMKILHNISLQIPKGQYISIMGPSGSGKTTLMQLLGCLDTPTDGELSILGNNMAQLSDDQTSELRSKKIGFIFQNFHLLPYYDAVSNVELSMVYSGRAQNPSRAQGILEKLGMSHRLHSRPPTLSGGEKQRVAIARAIANHPQILLADEPTGALDQTNGQKILQILKSLHAQGTTIILVTHDVHVAKHAERVVEIVDGRIRRDQMVRHE